MYKNVEIKKSTLELLYSLSSKKISDLLVLEWLWCVGGRGLECPFIVHMLYSKNIFTHMAPGWHTVGTWKMAPCSLKKKT
jgi:hypothetical protein